MNARLATKLTLAALLAAALPAARARACDDRDDRPVAAQPAPWQPAAPPPAFAPPPGGREHGGEHPGWRGGWRARELARLDAELRALDAERADVHARFAWRPWLLRRYDRGYLERRAALEHRRDELVRVAWR